MSVAAPARANSKNEGVLDMFDNDKGARVHAGHMVACGRGVRVRMMTIRAHGGRSWMAYIFLSHAWKTDELGRNTHERVCQLAYELERLGWNVWIDEKMMVGNIDACMARGIDASVAVVFCLTHGYFDRIGDIHDYNSCLKEWTYTQYRRKLVIPLIMEPSLLDISRWPGGAIAMRLASTLYIDASANDLRSAAKLLTRQLNMNAVCQARPITRSAKRLFMRDGKSHKILTHTRQLRPTIYL